MSYTPGPWSIKYLSGIDMLIVSENRKICSFSGFSHSIELMDEHENGERANANLIAAAPDLLEALELAAKELKAAYKYIDPEKLSSNVLKHIESAINKARAL